MKTCELVSPVACWDVHVSIQWHVDQLYTRAPIKFVSLGTCTLYILEFKFNKYSEFKDMNISFVTESWLFVLHGMFNTLL